MVASFAAVREEGRRCESARYQRPTGHPTAEASSEGARSRSGDTGNGLDLVAALLGPGTRAGAEEPGYGRARTILAARGAHIVPCPVDHDGLRIENLPDDLDLVYTTPAHQYPVGGRLPVPRRERLLAWAARTGALVVEDDYDAGFRYDVAPLPALYGLDPERVVLLGTLSKTLDPDLGVGWIVAEPGLAHRLSRLRADLTDRTSGPVQAATALLLERADLDRHLRRMRREYARRRALLVEHLGPRLAGETAGLHVLLSLPKQAVKPLIAAAEAEGVLVEDTSRTSHGAPRVHGLVIGYGSASCTELRRACQLPGRLKPRAGQGRGAPRRVVGPERPSPVPRLTESVSGTKRGPGR